MVWLPLDSHYSLKLSHTMARGLSASHEDNMLPVRNLIAIFVQGNSSEQSLSGPSVEFYNPYRQKVCAPLVLPPSVKGLQISYLAEPTWTGNPCSRTPPWYRRCSPATGWSSSWRWSARCSPPRRRSSTRLAGWSTPGSSHTGRTRSSRSPCTLPASCTSW